MTNCSCQYTFMDAPSPEDTAREAGLHMPTVMWCCKREPAWQSSLQLELSITAFAAWNERHRGLRTACSTPSTPVSGPRSPRKAGCEPLGILLHLETAD